MSPESDDFLARRGFERRLEVGLLEEADRFEDLGGRELRLDEVLQRAGGIRRKRRTTTALVAAAAVVALVAPAGVLLGDRDSAGGPGPASHPTAPVSVDSTPTPAPSPTPSPTPGTNPDVVHRVSIAGLSGTQAGAPPAQGYVSAGVWHAPDGSTWQAPGDPAKLLAIAPVGTSFLLATTDGTGRPAVELVGRDGYLVKSWPTDGGSGFVRSPGGQVAFVEPDGTPVVVDADGRGWLRFPDRVPRGSAFTATALLGGACTASDPCTVVVDSRGRHPEPWLVSSAGTVEPAGPRLVSVADAAPDGRLAGVTSIDEALPGTCSEVQDIRHDKLWSTCANRFVAFSPSGTKLLASGSYADGFGDTELAVQDARAGSPIVRYRTADGAAITTMQWEDDAHVLAVVFEKGRWAVLRLGLDGHVEVAVPPVPGGSDLAAPFELPAAD